MNVTSAGLNPASSGNIIIGDLEWKSVLNYIYASVVGNDDAKRKISKLNPSQLKTEVNTYIEHGTETNIKKYLREALEVKFEDSQLRSILLQTGRIQLRAVGVYETASGSSLDSEILEEIRLKIRQDELTKLSKRDEKAYLRRVKQATRLYSAMAKILMKGNSLEKFRHFSISSIPTELTQIDNVSNMGDVPPEIKSAAVSLDGNILYSLVRKNLLAKYKTSLPALYSSHAKDIVVSYVLNTHYPHFFEETVDKQTGDIKSYINTLYMSLENPDLDPQIRREKNHALEKAREKLEHSTARLTKRKLYKKQTGLLDRVAGLDAKIWKIYEQGKFPIEIMNAVKAKIESLYLPSELEIVQAESWTHNCLKYHPMDQTRGEIPLGSYRISSDEFPELHTDFPVSLRIGNGIFSSVTHYVLAKLMKNLIDTFPSVCAGDTPSDHLTNLTGEFVGADRATQAYKEYERKCYKGILTDATEKGLATWIERNEDSARKLQLTSGALLFHDSNSMLGTAQGKGCNIVGVTLERIRNLLGPIPATQATQATKQATKQTTQEASPAKES